MNIVNPLVSVGIPTYNRPQGLKRTLECITGQTYKNLEIIVGDNCSPGTQTFEVVKEFQHNDPRISYYRHEKNFGSDYNGKFVMEKATGDFYLSAADDDEWYPDYIEKCVGVLIQDDSIVMCTSNVILASDRILSEGENNSISPYWELTGTMHTYGMTPIARIKKIILNSGSNGGFGVYRTKLLKRWYFDPDYISVRFGSDRAFLAHINLYGSFYQIPEYLFVYDHGMGVSCTNPLLMKNNISKWEYYGLRIYPFLTAYINMIIDSLSWPVSITDHIRIIGYYLARMAKAKILRYTMKTPFFGTPIYDYKPPEYPKRE